MFERFTNSARQVVTRAQAFARDDHDGVITPVHLLLALAAQPDTPAARILAEHDVTAAGLAVEFRRMRRRGGLSDADVEALTELGIDADRVVETVEHSLGAEALAAPAAPRRRPRFDAAAKQVFGLGLREANGLGDNYFGSEHLLLALLRRPGPVCDVLADQRLTHEGARRMMLAARTRS